MFSTPTPIPAFQLPSGAFTFEFDPQYNVPGITFEDNMAAMRALKGLPAEEITARLDKYRKAVEAAGGCQPNWEQFTDYLLLSQEIELSEKDLLLLAGTSSGVGLLHLNERSDLTPNLLLMAAANNIGRHLGNKRRSIHAPFNRSELPDWMLRLGVEAATLPFREAKPPHGRGKLTQAWLATGLWENPTLPLLARARITVPQWWKSPDYDWCEVGTDRMQVFYRDQVAEQFPDLADLPAELVINILHTLPLDDSWGARPADPAHQQVFDLVTVEIETTRLKIEAGEL